MLGWFRSLFAKLLWIDYWTWCCVVCASPWPCRPSPCPARSGLAVCACLHDHSHARPPLTRSHRRTLARWRLLYQQRARWGCSWCSQARSPRCSVVFCRAPVMVQDLLLDMSKDWSHSVILFVFMVFVALCNARLEWGWLGWRQGPQLVQYFLQEL